MLVANVGRARAGQGEVRLQRGGARAGGPAGRGLLRRLRPPGRFLHRGHQLHRRHHLWRLARGQAHGHHWARPGVLPSSACDFKPQVPPSHLLITVLSALRLKWLQGPPSPSYTLRRQFAEWAPFMRCGRGKVLTCIIGRKQMWLVSSDLVLPTGAGSSRHGHLRATNGVCDCAEGRPRVP